MEKFKFEKLLVWQKAMDLGENMNLLTSSFPKKEVYNLSSQLMRAIDSVALNISEGAIGQTNPEQNRFIGYAIRSLAETVTCLHKAKRRDYINHEVFQKHYDDSFHLMNMLLAFRNKIK
jgi:four helix bundle protein